jgi:rRNA maturation RNase YbeY
MERSKQVVFLEGGEVWMEKVPWSVILDEMVTEHKYELRKVRYFFVSREKLLDINRQFLRHDYNTDVITFDYSKNNKVATEIFISLDDVRYNADKLGLEYKQECLRVMLHGVLHVLGFNDQVESERWQMRLEEDIWLNRISQYGNEL